MTKKVQTNLKLSARSAVTLDISSVIEDKDKAAIVEEALLLRQELMSADYRQLVEDALTLRFSDDPAARLRAVEAMRGDVSGVKPGESGTVEAARARMAVESMQPA